MIKLAASKLVYFLFNKIIYTIDRLDKMNELKPSEEPSSKDIYGFVAYQRYMENNIHNERYMEKEKPFVLRVRKPRPNTEQGGRDKVVQTK